MSDWLTAPDDGDEASITALRAELEALKEKIALGIVAAQMEAQGMAPEGRGREGGPGSSELPSPIPEGNAP